MTEKALAKRNGIDQAAILLLTVGEQEAADVLKHMSTKDVQLVGSAMAALDGVTREEVAGVLEHFLVSIESHTSLGVGTDEYLRKVLVSALGEDRAVSVLDRIFGGRSSRGLEAMKWMDPRAVAEMMRSEHPQIVAIVLAYLEPDHAAAVLAQLPEAVRPEILMRIATLDGIQPSALKDLNDVMSRVIAGGDRLRKSALGGVKTAAEIINLLGASVETSVLDFMRDADNELAQRIMDNMFSFDDLVKIDDKGIQALLKEIQTESLVIALKGATPELREKIFANMSTRAAETLREDLESRGPVRVSEVEAEQKELLKVVRRLADEGQIVIGGGGDDEFV